METLDHHVACHYADQIEPQTLIQIAGKEALAQAQQISQQAQAQGQSQKPMQGSASSTSAGGSSVAGNESENKADPKNTPPKLDPAGQADSRAADSDHDAKTAGTSFEREPWFEKLPPSLRNAVRAKARRRAPRGYEERLRRYFESLD